MTRLPKDEDTVLREMESSAGFTQLTGVEAGVDAALAYWEVDALSMRAL